MAGIDLLRFLASAAVAVYHLAWWVSSYPTGLVAKASLHAVRPGSFSAWGAWGFVGVQVFFVISGFVIAYTATAATPRQFAVSRVARLAPAVWVLGTVTALVAWSTGAFGRGELAWSWLRAVTFWPFGPWIDTVYWTLGVEVCFYGLMWLLLALDRSAWSYTAMLVIGSVSTAFWTVWALGPAGMLAAAAKHRTLDLLLIHHGCMFALGVWAHRRYVLQRPASLFWPVLFACGAVMEIVHQSMVTAANTSTSPMAIPAVAAWCAGMLLLWSSVTGAGWLAALPVRLTRAMGAVTYPFYLLHNVVGAAVMGGLVRIGAPAGAALAATLAACLGASLLVARLVEPPLQSWLKRTLAPGRASARLAH